MGYVWEGIAIFAAIFAANIASAVLLKMHERHQVSAAMARFSKQLETEILRRPKPELGTLKSTDAPMPQNISFLRPVVDTDGNDAA